MTLDPMELELLEDCIDDWRGLWEIAWMNWDASVQRRAELVSGLIERGLAGVLRVHEWVEAASAPLIQTEAAQSIVDDLQNYVAPREHEPFYLLAVTPAGEAAVQAAHSEPFGRLNWVR